MINPSHPLFFKPVVGELSRSNEVNISLRERGETTKLAKQFGLNGKIIGEDYENPIKKTLSIGIRTLQLVSNIEKFDVALSFENPMSVAASKFRFKKSILMLDNDLKYKIKGNFIQSIESRIKSSADQFIIPSCCENTFSTNFKKSRITTYDGYKEDIYIADYKPDKDFLNKIPFKDYFVIRPEAMASFYVESKESLVSDLLERFKKNGQNVVLLPRDKSDSKYNSDEGIHIPDEPLNGLDLIHYSDGVLTGSGTMAREAAVMGKPAVSFFPNRSLLSVDQDLIENEKMIHSREVEEIINYLGSTHSNNRRNSSKIKKEVLSILFDIIGE